MTVKSLTLIGAIIVPLLGSAAVEAPTPARTAHVGLLDCSSPPSRP
jgi:hypothetical protein